MQGVIDGVEPVAGGEEPVLIEDFRQVVHRRSPDLKIGVDPSGWIGRGTHVFSGEVHPAQHGGAAIDDGDLSMVSQIGGPFSMEREHRHKDADLASGVEERLEESAADAIASQGVQQQPDPDAGAGFIAEVFNDLPADRIAAEDEGHHMDGLFGILDHLQESGVGVQSVGKQSDFVALLRGRKAGPNEDPLGFAADLTGVVLVIGIRGIQFFLSFRAMSQFAAAKQQVGGHTEIGDDYDDPEPGDGGGGSFVFAQDAGQKKGRQEKAQYRFDMLKQVHDHLVHPWTIKIQ